MYFVITSILCGLMALGLLGLVGGKLSYLINLTKDGFHEVSVVKFIRGPLLLGIIIFLVFIVDILLSKVLDKGMRLKVVTCISGVLAIGVCLVTSQLSQLMRGVYFIIIVVASLLVIFRFENIEDESVCNYDKVFLLWSGTYALAYIIFTSTGVMIASSGLIYLIIGQVLFDKKYSSKMYAYILVFLLLIQRTIFIDDGYILYSECTEVITEGVLKGIKTTNNTKQDYLRMRDDINRYVEEGDKLMIIGGNNLGYSMGNVVCAAYSTDNFSFDDENNIEYWMNVRKPDVFLVYREFDENSVVGNFIIDNYCNVDGFVWKNKK